MKRSFLLAVGAVLAAFASVPAMAQTSANTLDETINNHGIPRQAPSLGLSSIYGLNPCSSGLSVGVTTPLFGIGGAAANIDKECEARNNAALAITALHDEKLAREIMCNIHDIREAAIRLHQPCIQDGGPTTVSFPSPSSAPGPSSTAVPLSPAEPGGVPRRYAPALPQRIPPPTLGTESDSSAQVPAFCRSPGLVTSAYPECVPGSPAALAALAPRRALSRPVRAPVVNRASSATRRPLPAAQGRGADFEKAPETPTQAVVVRQTAACTVPLALQAAYPACGTGGAGQRTTAPSRTEAMTVFARQP